MPTLEELETQIADLQGRVAFQEDMLQSLDQVIANQDQLIRTLQTQFKRWQSKMDEMSYTLESSSNSSEKPPHY